MTIDTMITLFDLIQDKANSAYFTDNEKLEFLNRAQIMFINEYNENNFPGDVRINERGFISTRSLENTLGNTDILTPLIVGNMEFINLSGGRLSTDSDGNLLNSSLESAITFNSGQSREVLKLLSLALIDGSNRYPIKYVRHNDLYKFLNNDFLVPTTRFPLYTINGDGYQVFPQVQSNLVASVVRYPIDLVYIDQGNAGNVSSELDDFTHDRILSIALDIAGISSRDQALIQLQEVINKEDRL